MKIKLYTLNVWSRGKQLVLLSQESRCFPRLRFGKQGGKFPSGPDILKCIINYNSRRLQEIQMPLHVLRAADQYPKNVSRQEIEKVLSKGRCYTGGLDFEVSIKEGIRVMLTNNVDIPDRFINGQLNTVARILAG